MDVNIAQGGASNSLHGHKQNPHECSRSARLNPFHEPWQVGQDGLQYQPLASNSGTTGQGDTLRASDSISQTDVPGTPTAQTPSQKVHGRLLILRSVSSRFVEHLPEFQPYSPTVSSPHRRRFSSSPAVVGKGCRANNTSPPGTIIKSSDAGKVHPTSAALRESASPTVETSEDKFSRKWNTFLLVSACLGIAAFISNSKARLSSRQQDSAVMQAQPSLRDTRSSRYGEGQSSQSHTTTTAMPNVKLNSSKLKKRPPGQIQSEILQSRRGSTYTEWKREMKSEVSANVSRRSSQRSQRSSSSRQTKSSTSTKTTSGRQLLQRTKQCHFTRRVNKTFFGILRCRGGRAR